MRRLLIVLCLTTLAKSILLAQSVSDLDYVHALRASVSKLNPRDQHEILHHLPIAASELRAEAVTFNGHQSFIVQARVVPGSRLCGNINCELWIFNSSYKILLDTSAEQIGYLPTGHYGQNDILIAQHFSAEEQALIRYDFDGTRYRKVRCAFVAYGNFEGKSYDPPHITVKPCATM